MSKEPIRIDLLIIKEENAEKVMKNEIGHIMRKYNVLEYKGPGDELSIDTLYKTLGYASRNNDTVSSSAGISSIVFPYPL